MCGFAGYWKHGGNPRLPEGTAERLAHRGPDASGEWYNRNLHLVHTRLKIQDVSDRANQPWVHHAEKAVMVFNGEVYNAEELRSQLVRLGVTFQTHSDTEVLFHWLFKKGAEGLADINGCFALAYCDLERGELTLARDPMGINPLYIKETEGGVQFASEARVLLDDNPAWSTSGVAQWLSLTFEDPSTPLVDGVRSLAPGEVWTSTSESWTVTPTTTHQPDSLLEALRESVYDRLVSDVPLGCFLSGGLDSAAVTALATKRLGGLKTFSLGFEGKGLLDERDAARATAEALKTDHHELVLSEEDMLGSLDAWISALDLPFGDASALAVYHLSRFARKQVTVALSGDGADELFAGYRRYVAWDRATHAGTSVQKLAGSKWASTLLNALPASRESALGLKVHQAEKMRALTALSTPERYAFLTRFVQPELVSEVWSGTCPALPQPQTLQAVLREDQSRVLAGDMLVKVDRMSMAHGLEVRVPFLDPRVVRAARALPVAGLIKSGVGKHTLRESLRTELPKEVFDRPKHGFEIPMARWLQGPLAADVNRVVSGEVLTSEMGWKPRGLEAVTSAFFQRPSPALTHLVWNLWVFGRWLTR